MKTFFKILGLVAFLLLLVVVVIGWVLPSEYTVSRERVIQSKATVIHQYVGDLTKWEQWSPWVEGDPSIVVTLGDQTQGVGANQSWTGESGSGSLTFTASDPEVGVTYDMEFQEGAYNAVGEIRYAPDGDLTKVTWTMHGEMDIPVMGGYLALLMDNMVGPMFSLGLEKLDRASGTYVNKVP